MKDRLIKYLISLLSKQKICKQGRHKFIITKEGYKNNGIEEGICLKCNKEVWRNILM